MYGYDTPEYEEKIRRHYADVWRYFYTADRGPVSLAARRAAGVATAGGRLRSGIPTRTVASLRAAGHPPL
jgi:hypothetical protein